MPRGDGTGPTGQGPGTGRGLGRGTGRGRGAGTGGGRGRMGGFAMGPGGSCICPSCGQTAAHQVGVACNQMKCPKCGQQMTRKQ
jgi:hypothetical protein